MPPSESLRQISSAHSHVWHAHCTIEPPSSMTFPTCIGTSSSDWLMIHRSSNCQLMPAAVRFGGTTNAWSSHAQITTYIFYNVDGVLHMLTKRSIPHKLQAPLLHMYVVPVPLGPARCPGWGSQRRPSCPVSWRSSAAKHP